MANLTQIEVNGVTYDLADLISGFVTASVNNLANYYLKSETYTKAEVQQLIAAIQGTSFVSVATLPTASAETMGGKIYLVPSSNPKTQNVKDEYITIESGGSYSWEQIGSTEASLDGYVTDAELTAALADYTTTASLTALLAAKQDVISDLATIRSGAAAGATAYQKPQTGIPASDLASGVIPDVSGKYEKPSTGIPKTDLAQGVQDSLALADSALQSFTETDPTVHAWAKQAQKPSYTAQEVGALPANTSIPSALSDLSEDTTHRVVTDTEKSTWNGKQDAIADLSAIRTGAGLGATAYQKPSTGIPASDLASGVIPDVSGKENTSNKVTSLSAQSTDTQYPSAKATYDAINPSVQSSQPAGGMLPNVLYKLGTLTGSVTIAFATPVDNTVENEYRFTFTADSTAPTITWPASITKWAGNALDSGLPNVEADTYYEVSVEDGMGIINKFE